MASPIIRDCFPLRKLTAGERGSLEAVRPELLERCGPKHSQYGNPKTFMPTDRFRHHGMLDVY